MILMYCFIGGFISVVLIPILYVKTIANQIFIAFNNKRQAYRGQNIVNLVLVTLLNPIVIIVSILIDLISLPNLLLKDSKNFEHKY